MFLCLIVNSYSPFRPKVSKAMLSQTVSMIRQGKSTMHGFDKLSVFSGSLKTLSKRYLNIYPFCRKAKHKTHCSLLIAHYSLIKPLPHCVKFPSMPFGYHCPFAKFLSGVLPQEQRLLEYLLATPFDDFPQRRSLWRL